jgi:hypothetical protein
MALVMRYWVPNTNVVRHHAGRSYTPNASGILDIPAADADSVHPDGAIRLGYVGATADRPVADGRMMNWPPKEMFDSSLNKPIFWVGSRWVDIAGSTS